MPPSDPAPRLALDQLSLIALRLGLIGLVGYGLLRVWGDLQFILLPFAIAVLLSALLSPVAQRLHSTLRLPRWIAAIVTVLLTICFVAGILTWVTPDIVRQTEDLATQVEDGIKQLPDLLHDLGLKDSDVQRFTTSLTDKLQDSIGTIGGQLSSGVLSAAQGVASVAASIFLALMMLIYLLMDGDGFWRGFLRFIPADRREAWHKGGHRSWTAVTHFVRSQVLVAAIDGIGIGVGLWILGIPLALPLGVLTFIVAFLPYIGAILAGMTAALVALSTNGVEGMIGAIVVTVIVQQIEGNVLYPLLIGRSVRLHPLTVLLAVGAGSALLGIVGAFLATPLVAAVAAGAGWLEEDEDVGSPAPEDLPGAEELAADDGAPPGGDSGADGDEPPGDASDATGGVRPDDGPDADGEQPPDDGSAADDGDGDSSRSTP